jgi:hypothetical protein
MIDPTTTLEKIFNAVLLTKNQAEADLLMEAADVIDLLRSERDESERMALIHSRD